MREEGAREAAEDIGQRDQPATVRRTGGAVKMGGRTGRGGDHIVVRGDHTVVGGDHIVVRGGG